MNILIISVFLMYTITVISLTIILRKIINNCKIPLDAECIRIEKIASTKGGTSYNPVFKYNYNEVTYEMTTAILFSKKEIKKYIVGNQYTIYVNPNNPKQIVESRKIPVSYYRIIISGFIILILSIWYMIDNMRI